MTKKNHILFLCSWFPSKELPTNGDFILRHAEATSLKHFVSTLHIISSKKLQKSIVEKHTNGNLTSFIGYVKYTRNPILKAIRFYKSYVEILKLIGNYDLIHLNTSYPFGLFALHQKFLKKKNYIISEHWTGYLNERKKKISFFKKRCLKLIIKRAIYVCPVSEELRLGMENLGLRGNYFTIGNVIDTSVFTPSNKKKNTFTIVHVSGLNDAQKNITEMLKTAKLLEDKIAVFNWKFIGGTIDAYEKLISDLEFKTAKIEFINHLSQTELAQNLQEATVCVSFSNYETFGIVLTEAIACGTFVISTKTGILNELEPQNFFSIIPVNDKNALAHKITHLYNNPIKLDVVKMHTFIKAQFSREVIAKAFSNLYDKTLNKSG